MEKSLPGMLEDWVGSLMTGWRRQRGDSCDMARPFCRGPPALIGSWEEFDSGIEMFSENRDPTKLRNMKF